MSHLHKDKERLRHQKQVRLLNEVMKVVPRLPHESQTRVRKLRHLVLYYHFMQMIHAQITKGCSTITNDGKKYVKKKTTVPVCESVKVPCETKRKPQRAHIVFLQVDKSVNQKEDILENSVSNDNSAETYYNYPESALATNSEYKVPEVILIDDVVENIVHLDQEIAFPSGNSNHIQTNTNNSISSDEYEIPLMSTYFNHYEKVYCDLESNIYSEDLFFDGKENFPPVAANYLVMNSNEKVMEESSLYDIERFPQSIIVNDENLMASKHKRIGFRSISGDCSDNSIVKDIFIPNITSERLQTSNESSLKQSGEYILNSSETYPFQNVSNYPINILSEKYQNAVLSGNNLYCKSDYNSAFVDPQQLNWSSSAENISDNSSSSTLTDKLNIDIENLSDSSNPSCTNFADSSNYFVVKNNADDTPIYSACDNTQLFVHDSPVTTAMSCEELENDCVLPIFSSSYNYFGNNILQNEVLFRSIGSIPQSFFGNIYPTSMSLNNSPTFIPSESVHSFPDRMVNSRFMNDNDSLYSPSHSKNSQSEEFSFKQPKLEFEKSDCFPESSSQGSKPAFFEKETSYPLSQYINSS